MESPCRVLIVDQSEESREVLEMALSRRGMSTYATGAAVQGATLARQHHPDLVVIDLDVDDTAAEALCGPLSSEENAEPVPVVLLGGVRRNLDRFPGGEFVPKPYHYGPLIRRIEELLEDRSRAVAVCHSRERSGSPIRTG
ncbi:MAG: response regulator [Patescibacteria group bacterium]|nr:response regulator [Patescibacteria group bacterium]